MIQLLRSLVERYVSTSSSEEVSNDDDNDDDDGDGDNDNDEMDVKSSLRILSSSHSERRKKCVSTLLVPFVRLLLLLYPSFPLSCYLKRSAD